MGWGSQAPAQAQNIRDSLEAAGLDIPVRETTFPYFFPWTLYNGQQLRAQGNNRCLDVGEGMAWMMIPSGFLSRDRHYRWSFSHVARSGLIWFDSAASLFREVM